MYLVKISCVLLAFLGTVVSGATLPKSPSQGTTSFGVTKQSNRDQDKGYHQQPLPLQYLASNLQSFSPITAVPLSEFFRINPDGTYAYRHAFANGGLRYEESYKVSYQNKEIFAVRGFYTYQLPDGKYLTVYYTADQYGFRETSSTITLRQSELPQSLGEGSSTKV